MVCHVNNIQWYNMLKEYVILSCGITSCKQAYVVCDENILYNIMSVILGVLKYIIKEFCNMVRMCVT